MEEQEWRRNTRRHATSRTTQYTNGALSPRRSSGHGALSAPTIASSNKSVLRQNEERKAAKTAATTAPLAPPSRWKEMRQAVRVKATIDTDERRVSKARIADLCEEDREKVAKLIRRIVEVGALHEESEAEFNRQRTLMETEIQELRAQVKEDAQEIDELSDKLKSTLEKLRDYQERVLVLEESNDLEVKHRMETNATVDLLKTEVDKLRKLVRKQKEEMDAKESEQRDKHREEMERVAQELKQTHELLLQERRERLAEKQKELEDRIQRSTTASTGAAGGASVEPNRYDEPQLQANALAVASAPSPHEGLSPLEMSSFLNMSADMPEKIKEIMNEWKTRMENALNSTAASIAQGGAPRQATASTACQTELDTSLGSDARKDRQVQTELRAARRAFDRRFSAKTTRRSTSPASVSSNSSHERMTKSSRQSHSLSQPAPDEEQSVARALLFEFVQPSVLVDDDSFEDEVESTIALIDTMHASPVRSGTARSRTARNLNLYESSLLDAVDAIESPAASSPRQGQAEAESPTLRVERLIQGLRLREQKLARVSTPSQNQQALADEPSFYDDVELFHDVRDVYEQDLDQGRRDELLLAKEIDAEADASDEEGNDRDRYVQDAIERDLEELLREQRHLRE